MTGKNKKSRSYRSSNAGKSKITGRKGSIPFSLDIVIAASKGDDDAIKYLQNYYRRYILSLSKEITKGDHGETHVSIDSSLIDDLNDLVMYTTMKPTFVYTD